MPRNSSCFVIHMYNSVFYKVAEQFISLVNAACARLTTFLNHVAAKRSNSGKSQKIKSEFNEYIENYLNNENYLLAYFIFSKMSFTLLVDFSYQQLGVVNISTR